MAASLQEINFLYDLRLHLNTIEDAEPYWHELYNFVPPFRHFRERLGALYPFASFVQIHKPEDLQQNTKIYYPEHVLRVSRLEYASPGAKDLLGIAGILMEIRSFIQFLIERPQNREAQELASQAQRIKNAREFAKLRVESARAAAEIESSTGYGDVVEDNTHQLVHLVEERKIVSVEMLGDQPIPKE